MKFEWTYLLWNRDPTESKAIHKEFPHFSNGPIRALPIGMPPIGKTTGHADGNYIDVNSHMPPVIKNNKDFSPLKWSDYFDSLEFMPNVCISS